MDRVSGFEPLGCGFDSCQTRLILSKNIMETIKVVPPTPNPVVPATPVEDYGDWLWEPKVPVEDYPKKDESKSALLHTIPYKHHN